MLSLLWLRRLLVPGCLKNLPWIENFMTRFVSLSILGGSSHDLDAKDSLFIITIISPDLLPCHKLLLTWTAQRTGLRILNLFKNSKNSSAISKHISGCSPSGACEQNTGTSLRHPPEFGCLGMYQNTNSAVFFNNVKKLQDWYFCVSLTTRCL